MRLISSDLCCNKVLFLALYPLYKTSDSVRGFFHMSVCPLVHLIIDLLVTLELKRMKS